NRGSRLLFWKASLLNRIHVCAISARPSTPIARFLRSSVRWNVRRRAHYNQAFALYDPATHRTLATRFGQDVRVSTLVYRSLAGWMLGYPEAALADADHVLEDARDSGHAVPLMYAQFHTSLTNVLCAKYAAANAQSSEVVRLADEKGAALWKPL